MHQRVSSPQFLVQSNIDLYKRDRDMGRTRLWRTLILLCRNEAIRNNPEGYECFEPDEPIDGRTRKKMIGEGRFGRGGPNNGTGRGNNSLTMATVVLTEVVEITALKEVVTETIEQEEV